MASHICFADAHSGSAGRFFAYMSSGPFEPDVSLHKVSADGVLTESMLIPTAYPSMVHDFVVTENYILFPVFPLTGSLERAMHGLSPFAWEPDKGASVGVLPRNGQYHFAKC